MKNDKKRRGIYCWVKEKKWDIVLLQETHCHLNKEKFKWSKEWNGHSIWSLGTSHSKGVTILFREKMKYDIYDEKIDVNGRYISFKLKHGEACYQIVNIYAPVDEYERVKFINEISSSIIDDQDKNTEIIIGGDYNCTMNNELDRYNCTTLKDIGQIDLKLLMDRYDLEDIWRRRYPGRKQFSWKGREKYSRIDYFLVSKSLDCHIDTIQYSDAPFSDHSVIHMEIRTTNISYGKGLWKMNISTIKSDIFQKSFKSMWNVWKTKKGQYDYNMWWDIGKRKVKDLAIWCSSEIIKKRKANINLLEQKIDSLKRVNNSDPEIEKYKNELRKIFEDMGEGVKIRSRVKWWEEGERSTRYFHQLEKRKGKEQLWNSIEDDEGDLVDGTENIQQIQIQFYRKLYQSQELSFDKKIEDKYLGNVDQQLNEESKSRLEEDITIVELSKALLKMSNNKSPGQDGICIEFYKLYWKDIKYDFYGIVRQGLDNHRLAHSSYLAIIKLLYKKGCRSDIRNWRPISLLNTDFKILSKALAERIKIVLPEIINTDQRGYIKGRYIGENIRLIEDVIHAKSDDSVILLLDQEKAFDRVEWSWLFKVLKKFNFGDRFISWIKTMYKYAQSALITNGTISEYFPLSRGIRQGDAMSALLFIIQAEPLSSMIRNNKDIKGINISSGGMEKELKLCQYVDDTNIFLQNSMYIEPCLKAIKEFEKISGAKLNMSKTKGIVVREENIGKLGDIELVMGPEKVLGVLLGKNVDVSSHWESHLSKLKTQLQNWGSRELSFQGKVHVIRSLGLSTILYSIEMQTIDMKYVRQLNDILWEFLWSGKKYHVPKEICTLPQTWGGLNMVDLHTLIKVKRIKWILRILKADQNENWTILPLQYIKCLDKKFNIDLFSLKATNTTSAINMTNIPQFYKECILDFQELNRKGRVRKNDGSEIIWGNDDILFQGEPLMFAHWSKSGLIYINDIIKDGKIQTNEIYHRLKSKAGYIFEIQTIKSCFKQGCLKDVKSNEESRPHDFDILNATFRLPNGLHKTLDKLSSKDLYSIILFNRSVHIASKLYWLQKFDNIENKWTTWFQMNLVNNLLPRQCKDFNWKLFHGQINTESRLQRMSLSDGRCKICCIHVEKLDHLLYECDGIAKIWQEIQNIVSRVFDIHLTIDLLCVLAGVLKDDKECELVNVLLSITRWEIWKRRNTNKYDNMLIPIDVTIYRIKYQIKQHVQLISRKNSSLAIERILNIL